MNQVQMTDLFFRIFREVEKEIGFQPQMGVTQV